MAAAVAVLLASPALAQQPSFEGVGDLPGGTVESMVTAVSADGGVAVGNSRSGSGMEAFSWTPGGGIVGLGFLSLGSPDSEANGVSGDGLVIVGTSDNGSGDRGFRWTSGGGMLQLGTFGCSGCDPTASASAVSGDGLVAVGLGQHKTLFGDPHLDSARWTGGGTGISDLLDLSGPQLFSVANGASQTGSTIVGEGDSNSGTQGWYWTSGGGMQALTGVPGAMIASGGRAISSDALTAVGYANSSALTSTSLEAVRWTGGGFGTIELLGALPGAAATSSDALAVSGDGAVIVGRARNASNANRAFIWDLANGMRELSTVLASDYGLDTSGWKLRSAHGVSDTGPSGEFTVVGFGTNPQGQDEGWVAFLIPPACRDGDDNDGDLDIDFPADAQCTSSVDLSEIFDCSDGLDNDGDGNTDYPADPGCASATDQTELPDCSDGFDNDGDGQIDYPNDAGCSGPSMGIEDPACDDGVDNDFDLATDFPADPECTAGYDLSETPDCSDGLDNDQDGDTDFPADADCSAPSDLAEAPECSDGIDNDLDGKVDYPDEFPDCVSADDPIEAPQCSDGVDNDLDGQTDHPADLECDDASGHTESPPVLLDGDVVVVDRTSKIVFGMNQYTGAQSYISEAALLSEPQGITQIGGGGALVVADPNGLVEIDPADGQQRLASPPLVAGASLQVVLRASGDAYVLESSGISEVLWNPSGLGAKSTFLPIPTTEPLPVIGFAVGDSLTIEADGNLLVGGFSLFGDGLFRVEAGTATPSLLKPGFSNDIWQGTAVEDDGTILAVGSVASGGPGVYRIDPVTGIATPLTTGAPWVTPVSVARNALGIWVADAGTCTPACTGGMIAHVDPLSGVVTPLASGGFIQGEMDIVTFVPEPGQLPMLLVGLAFLRVVSFKSGFKSGFKSSFKTRRSRW